MSEGQIHVEEDTGEAKEGVSDNANLSLAHLKCKQVSLFENRKKLNETNNCSSNTDMPRFE